MGFSASLVRSAPACAIPITAAPPSSASSRYSSFARHARGRTSRRRPPILLDAPLNQANRGLMDRLRHRRCRGRVRGVGRADGCVVFSREAAELATWTSGRGRWLFRPWPRQIAIWRNAWARLCAWRLCGENDLAGGPFGQVPRPGGGAVWPNAQTEPPPLDSGTITTAPECVQDYMIAWHARLGPILCPYAMTRSWGPCGAPDRHMTQDTSTCDEMRPAFARARERPS